MFLLSDHSGGIMETQSCIKKKLLVSAVELKRKDRENWRKNT